MSEIVFVLPPEGMTAIRYSEARPRTPSRTGATSTKSTWSPGIVPPEVSTTTSLIFVSREKLPSIVSRRRLELDLDPADGKAGGAGDDDFGKDGRRRSSELAAHGTRRIARVRLRAGEGRLDRLIGVGAIGMLLEYKLDRPGIGPRRHRADPDLLTDQGMARLGDGPDLADLGLDQSERCRDPVILVERDLFLARPLELPLGLVEGLGIPSIGKIESAETFSSIWLTFRTSVIVTESEL